MSRLQYNTKPDLPLVLEPTGLGGTNADAPTEAMTSLQGLTFLDIGQANEAVPLGPDSIVPEQYLPAIGNVSDTVDIPPFVIRNSADTALITNYDVNRNYVISSTLLTNIAIVSYEDMDACQLLNAG